MWPEVLAHLVPFQHGPASEPYIVIGLLAVGLLVAVVVGILVAGQVTLRSSLAALAPAFSAGALLFLFLDLAKEAASLGQGLVTEPVLQAALLAAFAIGALFIPLGAGAAPSTPARWAWLWAVGIAAHGAGEAWIIGTEASSASVVAPLGVASFLLHKAIEGFTIPVVAGGGLDARTGFGIAGVLAVIAAMAGVAGFVARSGSGTVPLGLFAAGAGAAGFAIVRLGGQRPLGTREAAVLVLGVVVVYLAGVLHEW